MWWSERSPPGLRCSTTASISTGLFHCTGTVRQKDLITWVGTKCNNNTYNPGNLFTALWNPRGTSPPISSLGRRSVLLNCFDFPFFTPEEQVLKKTHVGKKELNSCFSPHTTKCSFLLLISLLSMHLHLNVKIETYQHIHITCWWWGWKNHEVQEVANVWWFEREERHLYTRPVAMQQTNCGIFRCYFEFLVTLRRCATGEVEYRSSRGRLMKIAEKGTPPQRTHSWLKCIL